MMVPWELIDNAEVPGSGDALRLYKRGEEFSIRTGSCELMNSRLHGSEDALAELVCERIKDRLRARVLIGGLGMGYTAAAALKCLGPESKVVVAELVPAVVEWNRGPIAHLAGSPLRDSRVSVRKEDVANIIKEKPETYDAILLDVDNGPEGLTQKGNDQLYVLDGLYHAFMALKPGGALAIWSSTPDKGFTRRFKNAGFRVDEISVRARGASGGARHMIWIGIRSSQPERSKKKKSKP